MSYHLVLLYSTPRPDQLVCVATPHPGHDVEASSWFDLFFQPYSSTTWFGALWHCLSLKCYCHLKLIKIYEIVNCELSSICLMHKPIFFIVIR